MSEKEIEQIYVNTDPAPPVSRPIGYFPLIKNGMPPHPGNLLAAEMAKIGLSPYRLAKLIGVQRSRLERMVAETHPVSPDTALRLGKFFGISAEKWMDDQTRYDLAVLRKALEPELNKIHSIKGG